MKKERLEQAMNGIDPAFLEEAAAPIPAKVHRPLWKRAALTAACLAAVLAVSAVATAVTEGWELYFSPNENGVELPSAEIHHGGASLPEETKEQIRSAAIHSDADQPYALTFSFHSLAEMESFLGCDLLESSLYPVSTEEEIQCRVHYSTGKRMAEDGWEPWEEFALRAEYAFDKGGWNNWVTVSINTFENASLTIISQEESFAYEITAYPLKQLDTTASVLSTSHNQARLYEAYLLIDHAAYEIRCTKYSHIPTDFLDSLY